jgi:hypothetical protein
MWMVIMIDIHLDLEFLQEMVIGYCLIQNSRVLLGFESLLVKHLVLLIGAVFMGALFSPSIF